MAVSSSSSSTSLTATSPSTSRQTDVFLILYSFIWTAASSSAGDAGTLSVDAAAPLRRRPSGAWDAPRIRTASKTAMMNLTRSTLDRQQREPPELAETSSQRSVVPGPRILHHRACRSAAEESGFPPLLHLHQVHPHPRPRPPPAPRPTGVHRPMSRSQMLIATCSSFVASAFFGDDVILASSDCSGVRRVYTPHGRR